MKITVKKGNTIIVLDESDNAMIDQKTSIRWVDQMQNIHETIGRMVEQCIMLSKSE
tara:strand:+ start:451 stop:618 length:168 start_codon:yes stop_codon:yes gene_type:complete